MDNDDAPPTAAAATTRRPSTTHDRPTRTPFGPRIRTKTKHSDTTDTPSSPLSSSALSRPDSPTDPTPSISIASSHLPIHTDAAIQAPSTPHRSTAFVTPPALTPPPAITFESTPIPWKGLPFDAAQWTFSSSELQDIVSKAIRLSASDSFVRLLSAQALEVDIAQEQERLDSDRATAQAKWRFEVGRRTMLMQALNSSAATEPEDENLVAGFISQLASSIASCDTLLASILYYSDQQSQIALLEQKHWASALAVALRKLNKAYERQGQELKRAKDRVQTLEDELEEAWREAEKMAIEFDELEDVAESEESSGAPEDNAETPGVSTESDMRPDLEAMHDIDETGTLGDMTINTDIAVVVGVTATAVASKATLFTPPAKVDKSDARSVRSAKSTRSRRSTHLLRLSAARTRSRAASNASLRLPKSLRSPASGHPSPVDAPPVPSVQSFLDMDLAHERMRKDLPPPPRTEPSIALPTPPHSAGLAPTRVPSIWLETDGGKSTPLNGLDRTHSLHIFSSLAGRTSRRARRSNLVMSLQGRGSDRSDSTGVSPVDSEMGVEGNHSGAGTGTGTGSPLSSGSPVSLPTALTFHVRGPSLTSSSASVDALNAGKGKGAARPGSAGARLTADTTRTPATPRRSLVSRASSIIMRRLSQATIGSMRTVGTGDKRLSPSRSREALRLSANLRAVEVWAEDVQEEGEGEVMVIGAPRPESSEGGP